MGAIRDTREALIARIKATLGQHVAIDKWAGEAKAKESIFPAVHIQYMGAIARESEEIGAVSYQFDTIWMLHVMTEDNATGADGDDEALDYLDSLRQALHSYDPSDDLGRCAPYRHPDLGGQTESLGTLGAGRYLYGQCWKVERYIE